MSIRKLDNFDLVMLAVIGGALLALAVFIYGSQGSDGAERAPAYEIAVQKQMMRQARMDHLGRIYQPAQQALAERRYPEALLALEEIGRRYPGEPHGLMLRGEAQLAMGAIHEGVVNVATAVRRDAEYLEEQSPLSRRSLLEQLVGEVLPRLRENVREVDPTPGQLRSLQELRYLQSRLAGGCE